MLKAELVGLADTCAFKKHFQCLGFFGGQSGLLLFVSFHQCLLLGLRSSIFDLSDKRSIKSLNKVIIAFLLHLFAV